MNTVIFEGCEGHVFYRVHNWSLDLKQSEDSLIQVERPYCLHINTLILWKKWILFITLWQAREEL